MAPIGIGLLGAGKHALRYLRHVRADVPALRLVALSRRDAEAGRAMAAELGARFHADWRALVDDSAVEAVLAVVPPTLNLAIAEAVARRGKALLIEKPLAPTGAEAVAIVRTLRASGVPVLMAHTLRWNAVVRAVRARLPALGELRALVLNQRFEPSSLEWLDDPAISGGGIITHTGVHAFDLVRFLTGHEVRRVWCRAARTHTRRTEDNFSALFELAGSPAQVVVGGSRDTRGRSGMIDAACTGGQLVADHQLGYAFEVHGLERTALAPPEPVPTVREALHAFVALLRHGEEPPVTVEDGARAVLIAEACRDAARRGEPVDVAALPA